MFILNMPYSEQDIREIMKMAPHISDARAVPLGGSLPEHYLTANSLKEYHELGRTFMAAARRRDSRSAATMDARVEHEGQHGYAIIKLGGLAVYTLVVYKPEGLIDRRYPFDVKTRADGLEHGSPEFTVSTGYPKDLSRGDQGYLDRRGLSVADVDRIAVEHGWHDLRPLSLPQDGKHS
jgi:hypothetical protein